MVLWKGFLSTAPLNMFNLSGAKYRLCIVLFSLIGMFSFLEGKLLRWSAKIISFLVCTAWCNCIFVSIITFFVSEVVQHG